MVCQRKVLKISGVLYTIRNVFKRTIQRKNIQKRCLKLLSSKPENNLEHGQPMKNFSIDNSALFFVQ